jgi:hypothetical protein
MITSMGASDIRDPGALNLLQLERSGAPEPGRSVDGRALGFADRFAALSVSRRDKLGESETKR